MFILFFLFFIIYISFLLYLNPTVTVVNIVTNILLTVIAYYKLKKIRIKQVYMNGHPAEPARIEENTLLMHHAGFSGKP